MGKTSIQDILTKVDTGIRELEARLVDMEDAILLRYLAIIASVDCFFLSGPGRAKTLLDTLIGKQMGMKVGRWQMSKDVVPDFLFGPPAVSSLLKDKMQRNTEGMLPEMDLVTLEEIGNANGPCLDALRMVMSDRVFRNNGGEQPIPLISLTGLSNTWLSGDTIGPVWDRFLIRYELPAFTAEARRAMLDTIVNSSPAVTDNLLCRKDIEALHEERDRMAAKMPAGVIATADKIFQALEEKGIISSPRRYMLSLQRLVPAYALLCGSTTVEEPHLMVLQHCLWHDPKDKRSVKKVIGKIADPLSDFLSDMEDEIADLKLKASEIENTESAAARMTAAVDISSTIKDGIIPRLDEKIASNPSNKRLTRMLDVAHKLHVDVVEKYVMA